MPKDNNFNKQIKKELDRIINQLYKGGKIVFDSKLLILVGNKLQDAIFNGFGKNFSKIDWDSQDTEMLMKLTQNIWHFSSAKNYKELQNLSLALKNNEGKLRSFDEFKQQAIKINKKFDNVWLKTEYTQAVLSATSSARWVEYIKNAKDMPYIQYQTIGDKNVRNEHQLLNGITKKHDHSFWDTHFPPNGWRCRCSTIQLPTSNAHETNDKKIPKISIAPMFKTNIAKTGIIFPKQHAYFNGMPLTELRKAIWHLPINVAYKELYKGKNGEILNMHTFHGIGEARENIATAKILLKKQACKKIELLPILDKNDDKLREKFYGTKNFVSGKNPDALIDGKIFDITMIKKPNKTKIKRKIYEKTISKKGKQADNICIELKEKISEKEINQAINGTFNQSTSVNKVIIINKDTIIERQNLNYQK